MKSDWRAQAACLGTVPTSAFFTPPWQLPDERAVAVCKGCPVREPCLAYALDGMEQGRWGGTTARQRMRLRTERRREVA